ncbi:phospholipase-like protein [Tanacetum coccineum]
MQILLLFVYYKECLHSSLKIVMLLSGQPVTKMELEFERRRITNEDVREFICREILEYHPNMVKEFIDGAEPTGFIYPRGAIYTLILFQGLKQSTPAYLTGIEACTQVSLLFHQMEKLLSRTSASMDSRTMQYVMHPVIETLIANELMRHSDMEVNIALACCICDVLRSMGHIAPYNDEQLKDFYEMVVNTFEKLASVSHGCYIYTKMSKVLKTLSSGKFSVVAKAVYRYLGRTIPSTIYTRTLECQEGPANIVQTETHCQHGTWDTAQSAEHGENLVGSRIKIWWRKDEIYYEGLVKSFDFISKRHKVMYDDGNEEFIDLKMKQWDLIENVSATLDSLGQALPTKVSTPQSDEYVWNPKDTKNFQGVATVSDCRNKRLKLSCDHGDEELLDLSGQQWELVENVSPMWDCMEQDMPKKLTSPQFGTVSVQGYKVKNVNASILETIFKKHGDIAADCVFKTTSVREPILEVVCDVVRQIQTNDVMTIISEMAEIESQVSAAEANKINVSWLRAHLESIHKRNNAKKNCSLLMKTKANTSMVTRAAKMDLKSAKEQFENAERCVKVLDLVEKKLHENFLESKAEKDSWAKQPILLAN